MTRRSTPPYRPPTAVSRATVAELNNGARGVPQQQLLRLAADQTEEIATLFCAGRLTLLHGPAVAIVGSRKSSVAGKRRAYQLARSLAGSGVVVVSGLARGIDTAAHRGALDAEGATCAVIGTPIDLAYPAENRRLQEQIYADHLLVSPFPIGSRVYASNFPIRNKVMAALTDATVIVEASDTSGALHQASECKRMRRPLLIPLSLTETPGVTWPKRFLDGGHATVLRTPDDILAAIRERRQ